MRGDVYIKKTFDIDSKGDTIRGSKYRVVVGVEQNELSLYSIIQFIFRGCIRNGEEMFLYMPSTRMESILKNWLNNVTDDSNYIMPDDYDLLYDWEYLNITRDTPIDDNECLIYDSPFELSELDRSEGWYSTSRGIIKHHSDDTDL